MNAEIRLRRGTISANNTSTDSLSNGTDPGTNSSGNASNFNFYVDQYGTGSSTNTQVPQAYNITNTSLIAGTKRQGVFYITENPVIVASIINENTKPKTVKP